MAERKSRSNAPADQQKVTLEPSVLLLIQQACTARGWGAQALSVRTGLPRATCHRIITGASARYRGDYLDTILAALGLSARAREAIDEARFDGDLLLVKLDALTLQQLTRALNTVAQRPPRRPFHTSDARRLLQQIGA